MKRRRWQKPSWWRRWHGCVLVVLALVLVLGWPFELALGPRGGRMAPAMTSLSPTSSPGPSPSLSFVTGSAEQMLGERPLADWPLFVDPVESSARAQAEAWRQTRPADAARMDKMAAQPQSKWVGDWFPDPYAEVYRYVGDAANAHKLPVLTVYNLPSRDCGLYSKGGAASFAAYASWINRVAQGLGQRPVIVVLEPDAIAELDCYGAVQQTEIYQLLKNATATLEHDQSALVYLDAGDAETQTAAVTAGRLKAGGIANAAGFSLNVSSFWTTAQSVAFGNEVSGLVGGKHFIVDTSRNGAGHPGAWCNPPGRALGQSPTLHTSQALADGYLWVKIPGESDGDCGRGEPDPGVWWPDYALGLAVRAGY